MSGGPQPRWGTSATAESPAFNVQRKPRRWIVFALASVLYLPATVVQWTARDGWWITLGVVLTLVGIVAGVSTGLRGRRLAGGRLVCAFVLLLAATVPFVAYALAWLISSAVFGARGLRSGSTQIASPVAEGKSAARPSAVRELRSEEEDPLTIACRQADPRAGRPGGHMGWNDKQEMLAASPRGGLLVIGPPGAGKSSAVLIPSVLLAPGAAVVSSIKGDLLKETWAARQALGEPWLFDPRPDVPVPSGVERVRWSPLVGIHRWDDARTIAARMAEPLRSNDKESHFVDRATAWLEVLLWAAASGNYGMRDVLRWVNRPVDEEGTVKPVVSALSGLPAGDERDIPLEQYAGLTGMDERERSSVASTMTRMVRVYSSPTVLAAAKEPNFDPDKFVRSGDTLYVVAPAEMQAQFAPLIVALLEAIRQAAYRLHDEEERAEQAAQEAGTAYQRPPHITFVLDEANNAAPIPLPAIIADAGGQGVHIIVGIQDRERAIERWGKGAESFLSLFPSKMIFGGLLDETTEVLSRAAGEFDRVTTSHSQSVVTDRGRLVTVDSPSTTIARQRIVTPADISSIPAGQAMRWIEGGRWELVNVGMHWRDPYWKTVIARSTELLIESWTGLLQEDPATFAPAARSRGFLVEGTTVRAFADAEEAQRHAKLLAVAAEAEAYAEADQRQEVGSR